MAIIVHPRNRAAPTNLIKQTVDQAPTTKDGKEIMKW
jgi:hypothetical protein